MKFDVKESDYAFHDDERVTGLPVPSSWHSRQFMDQFTVSPVEQIRAIFRDQAAATQLWTLYESTSDPSQPPILVIHTDIHGGEILVDTSAAQFLTNLNWYTRKYILVIAQDYFFGPPSPQLSFPSKVISRPARI